MSSGQLFYPVLAALLVLAAVTDWKTRTIPPGIPLAVLALAPLNDRWSFAAALAGVGVCGGLLLVTDLFCSHAFGGGDIKLVAACAYALGYEAGVIGLFAAVALSLIPCAYYHITKKQTVIAFAPYLAVGYLFAAL